jgi:tRNA (guanine37-N1)-methyltransferase
MNKKSIGYDIMGNVAVMKFSDDWSSNDKKKFAEDLLKRQKSVTTVLEKTGKFKGRLRKMETKWVSGEKTKEVLYRENNCVFRFNIDTTYFSPRLSNERIEIAKEMKKGDEVLVMCAGVAPFPIVIAKNSKVKMVWSNELNKEANKYAILNIERNKVKDRVELLPGDIKKFAIKLKEKRKKFDVIVMARPQLKDSFLREAFMLSKKGTRIYYYDFCSEEDVENVLDKVKDEAKKSKIKIKIKKWKSAGDIAPYKIRIRVDMIVC